MNQREELEETLELLWYAFEELKEIQDSLDAECVSSRIQELIWKIGKQLGDFRMDISFNTFAITWIKNVFNPSGWLGAICPTLFWFETFSMMASRLMRFMRFALMSGQRMIPSLLT
jgi:hypothetical protein